MEGEDVEIGAYLTGAFGQSQALYNTRNAAKRGRGTLQTVEEQCRQDTQHLLDAQRTAGFSFITDPLFRQYYLFQPFATGVHGAQEGSQENWFNTNVFYRKPVIHTKINVNDAGFTNRFLQIRKGQDDQRTMVILPSPYTLLMLSDTPGYASKEQAIEDLAMLLFTEAQNLVSQGVQRIQFDEPALVYKQTYGRVTEQDKQLIRRAFDICGSIMGATTCLQTYFGDAGSLLPFLGSLPVDCVGVDLTETKLGTVLKWVGDAAGKELALGIVDARNTLAELPEELCSIVQQFQNRDLKALWLTPNTGFEYIGWTEGLKKMEILRKTIERLEHG